MSPSRSWTSSPPRTRLKSRSPGVSARRSRSRRIRSDFRPRSASSAPSVYPGASSTSTKCPAIRSPSASSIGRFSDRDAAERRDRIARRAHAPTPRSIEPATATPHGFACLTITAAGSANSRMTRRAPSRSARLLYESSFPPSCSTSESRCRARPTWRSTPPPGAGSRRRRGRRPCGRPRQLLGEGLRLAEPAGDRRLVGRGGRERLGGERRRVSSASQPLLAQLREHGLVLLRAGRPARRARSSSRPRAAWRGRRRRSSRPPPPRSPPPRRRPTRTDRG